MAQSLNSLSVMCLKLAPQRLYHFGNRGAGIVFTGKAQNILILNFFKSLFKIHLIPVLFHILINIFRSVALQNFSFLQESCQILSLFFA